MIENILYLFPEISLLVGIILVLIQKIFSVLSIKSYFKLTSVTVIISALFSILFYNKNVFPAFFETNSYTILFYILSCFMIFAWLNISIKWFVSEDTDPFIFCILSLLALFSFSLIIKTVNLGILFIGLTMLSSVNYSFLKFSQQNEEFHNVSNRYLITTGIFSILAIIGLFLLTPEYWNYTQAAEFLGSENIKICVFIICSILFYLLFLIGIAPFHFCFADIVSPAVLPVAVYFNLIPLFSLFCVFIKINTSVFVTLLPELTLIYTIFGALSLIVGAIGANASRNLRKIFAYCGIYNLGMILLLLLPFNSSDLLGGFIYLQVYVLALFGIYTTFYSFKSNGVYLTNLNMINGIAKVRPFISAALLFFMISLMGISPFPGFIGQLSVLENIVTANSYFILFIALFSMIVLMAAFLQIIRSLYFNNKETEFNRPDYGVYAYLSINIILIIILIFKPEFLLYDAPAILNLVLE